MLKNILGRVLSTTKREWNKYRIHKFYKNVLLKYYDSDVAERLLKKFYIRVIDPRTRNVQPPPPAYIMIEPTTKCNAKCVTCTRKELPPTRLNIDLTYNEWLSIKEKIDWDYVALVKLQGYGEPLLNPNLFKIAKDIKRINKSICIETTINGSLGWYFADKIIKNFDRVNVSLDSLNKMKFMFLRPGIRFSDVLKTIKSLSEKRKSYTHKIMITINVVVSHINYNEVPDIVNYAHKSEVDAVILVHVENWRTPLEKEKFLNDYSFIAESRKYMYRIAEIIRKVKKEYSGSLFIQSSEYPKKRKRTCWWPFHGTFISVDGYVTPCCIRMNPSVINFGNIFNSDKLTDIWWCKNYMRFRLSILKDTFNPICDLCPD